MICRWLKRILGKNNKPKIIYPHQNNIQEWNAEEKILYTLLQEYSKKDLIPDKEAQISASNRVDYQIKYGEATHNMYGIERDRLRELGSKGLEEIVGFGFISASSTFKAFQKSEAHNEIMLNPRGNLVGISVKRDKENKLFITVLFNRV